MAAPWTMTCTGIDDISDFSKLKEGDGARRRVPAEDLAWIEPLMRASRYGTGEPFPIFFPPG